VETELLGADKIGAESLRIELAVRVELRDSDREPHGPIVSAGQPGTPVNGSAKTTGAKEQRSWTQPAAIIYPATPGHPAPAVTGRRPG
jgi:hypothetical protein